ncbi:MAG: RHS repeat-associated core domain-containing protein [Acidobacteriota bacterium]|jgi:RHS repeat-associated protein
MFTGKERDEGTGLDNFLARYYNAPVGRFTSPDAPFADQEAEDPQSWNLFAYGRNNPLRFTDPTGRTVCDVNGNHCRDEITVTDTMEKIAVYMFVTTAKVVQSTQEMVQPVADWMNRPRNPICTDGYMGLGASIGFWAGGGLGTLGLAGGPAVAATIPGGAAGGAALGGAIGGFGGLILCSTGSGQGNGGNTQHGEERISGRNMSPAEIAEAKTGQAYTQSDGATAYVKKLASGRYNVVVEGEGGIITVMKNKTAGEIRRLGQNYGWH